MSDDSREATLVTLTDAQIEALANRELAIVKTDGHVLALVHEDRSAEARAAAEQLAETRDAEFEVSEVTERV